jgi:hypothetical protein
LEKSDLNTKSNKKMDWSSILTNNKSKSPEELNVVNAIVAVNKDMERREKNVVILGLPISTEVDSQKRKLEDLKLVKDMFNEININLNDEEIKRTYRFRLKKEANSTVEQTNQQSSPLLVELPSTMVKIMVLKAAKMLKGNEKYENVYINPDQNEAELKLTRELVSDRNERIKKLELKGKLNKPFRYGFRFNRVVEVFVEKRTH